jgi:hypothetical protein
VAQRGSATEPHTTKQRAEGPDCRFRSRGAKYVIVWSEVGGGCCGTAMRPSPVDINTRTSHYESFTMIGTGYTLNEPQHGNATEPCARPPARTSPRSPPPRCRRTCPRASRCAGSGSRRAAGESAMKFITRIAHSEALVVSGTGYDVDHPDQPRVRLPLSAQLHSSTERAQRHIRTITAATY